MPRRRAARAPERRRRSPRAVPCRQSLTIASLKWIDSRPILPERGSSGAMTSSPPFVPSVDGDFAADRARRQGGGRLSRRAAGGGLRGGGGVRPLETADD